MPNATSLVLRRASLLDVYGVLVDQEMSCPADRSLGERGEWLLHRLVWQLAWYPQDKRYGLTLYDVAIDSIRAGASSRSGAVARDYEEAHGPRGCICMEPFYISVRFPMANAVQHGYGPMVGSREWFQTETLRSLTRAAVALKRHQLRHGGVPQRLEELVPEFLPEVPTDFMDGKPLRYKPLGAERFLLYSVGNDGVDDGGNPEPEKYTYPDRKRLTIWTGKDAVWPQHATSEEVEAFRDLLKGAPE